MTLPDANFKILAPLAVTETELVSGIPDAENQVFNGTGPYAAGALVWDAGHVYQSKVDDNTDDTAVTASWDDLGEIDEGALEYAGGTTYNIGDFAVYQGQLWKCAADNTSGLTPSVTASEWVRQGATTRLKAFDGFLQDEASLSGEVPYVLEFADLVTDIAILRASGTSVNITMTDDTEGEVYSEDFDLQDDSAITDAWEYCFAPFIFIESVLAQVPPYAGAEIAITFDGDSTSVGQIVAGAGLTLGSVKTGTSVGIESYSIKDRDDFNRSLVVARPYSDTATFDLAIPTLRVGYVKGRLAARDALPTLYYMAEGAEFGAIAYGFFRDFDILHSTPVVADCVLEIEGLG